MSAFTETHRLRASTQILLLLLLAVMILPWLGETLFYSKGEPREAIQAVSCLKYGDWLLPLSYGSDLPYKPPFLGWCIAVFSWLFNGGEVNEYLSRLPSALALILMCWAIFRWAGKWRGERFGFICAMVTATTFEVFRAGTNCRVDMILTAAMVSAMLMMYDLHEMRNCRDKALRWLAVIILLSIATLTKGPVGALLPCFIMGVYALLRGDRFFPTLGIYLGVAVASLLIPALWYYAAYLEGGPRFTDLMIEENFGRLLGKMSYESHVNPWWYNIMSLAAGLAPWTLLLILACFDIRRYRREAFKPMSLFSFVAVLVVVIFFTIPASKRSVYLLPAYPFLAYWITCIIDSLRDTKVMKGYTWMFAIIALLVVIAVIALQFVSLPKANLAPVGWGYLLLLAAPLWASLAWMRQGIMKHGSNAPLYAVLITASLFLVYLAIGQPMAVNNRSDKAVLSQVEAQAGNSEIYSIDAVYPPFRCYTLNFYMNDRMKGASSFEQLDSLPAGTVVLFSDIKASPRPDSAEYEVTQLLKRSCDNRKPLMMAVKRNAAPAITAEAGPGETSATPAVMTASQDSTITNP